jgi:uncharacterized RDD family membrane protein YckC
MSSMAGSPDGGGPVEATRDEGQGFVGVVTRAVSWVMDALLINLAAIIAGIGTALVLEMFPVSKTSRPVLAAIAGVVYVVWTAAYFVLFWSTTGQTPGARVMQIRLVSATGQRVKPIRALVRWVGMNLAALPLFAGYVPILFRRRGFPDWLAHTLVLEASHMSLTKTRQKAKRAARGSPNHHLRGFRDERDSVTSTCEVPEMSPATATIAPTTNQRHGQTTADLGSAGGKRIHS